MKISMKKAIKKNNGRLKTQNRKNNKKTAKLLRKGRK